MKLKIMIMALLMVSVGIGSAVNTLPATTFVGDIDFASGYYARNATRGIYYVDDYGATGDGATNDLAAIRAAYDAAVANGAGVLKFSPGGEYRIDGNLSILDNHITLDGQELGASLQLDNDSYINIGNGTDYVWWWCIKGLEIEPVSGASPECGLILWNGREGIIENCFIHGFTDGIRIKANSWSNKIYDCVECYNTIGINITGTETNALFIRGGRVNVNGIGISIGGGSSGIWIDDVQLEKNSIDEIDICTGIHKIIQISGVYTEPLGRFVRCQGDGTNQLVVRNLIVDSCYIYTHSTDDPILIDAGVRSGDASWGHASRLNAYNLTGAIATVNGSASRLHITESHAYDTGYSVVKPHHTNTNYGVGSTEFRNYRYMETYDMVMTSYNGYGSGDYSAATTPGSCTIKIPWRDASGTVIAYIAGYNTIT